MHPMVVKLFLEPDTDDPLAEEQEAGRRRAARRARRAQPRLAARAAASR